MESGMTITRPILAEALTANDSLIPPQHKAAYDRAEAEWGDTATTNAGEYAVIAAAQAGEESAKLFLLQKALSNGSIQQTLWKFLGPNTNFQRMRISQGDTAIYRSIVSESLEQILLRWNLDTTTTKEDYFSNFFFQVASRIKTNTSRYNTEQNRGGMSGKVMKGEEEPNIGSYEVYTDKDKNHVASHHDPFRGSENLDAWQTFVDDPELDAGKSPTMREVLKHVLSAGTFDTKAAGQKFGKSHVTIYGKLRSMKGVLESHGINDAAFMDLMQTHGAKGLSETL